MTFSPDTIMSGSPTTGPTIVPKRQSFPPGFVTFTPRASHLVVVKLSSTWLDCRIADRHLQHETSVGSFAILPNGADCGVLVDRDVADTLTLTIDREAFGTFVDDGTSRSEPREVLGGHDLRLTDLALALARVPANDRAMRDRLAHHAMSHITSRYSRVAPAFDRGSLAPAALQTVQEFIFDNIADDLTIARLAATVRLSPYHFSRNFARTTGVSPHRYIMQARADQAAAAIRHGRQGLAEIAFAFGFADQSHMCRWIHRRYARTPTSLRKAKTIG